MEEELNSSSVYCYDQVTSVNTPPRPDPSCLFSRWLALVSNTFASQTLSRKADEDDGGGDEGSSGLAFRTRSKHPLVDVPLGQLEAELLAPDITEDMYEQMSTQQEEDRQWTTWLQGLMAPAPEGQSGQTVAPSSSTETV